MVGIEEKDSKLNLTRFRDFSHLYNGACSFCSQCCGQLPGFQKLSEEFATRSEGGPPPLKRAIAMAMDVNKDLATLQDDPLLRKIFDLCLLCGQCTFKCATNASMRDIVIKMREARRSKAGRPGQSITSSPIRVCTKRSFSLLGETQGIWSNKLNRKLISLLPKELLPTRIPYQRLPAEVVREQASRRDHPELVDIPTTQADIAYFYGCSSDLVRGTDRGQFYSASRKRMAGKISLPPQRCCGEPFSAVGNLAEAHRLAR